MLRQHPEVFFYEKEIHFFDKSFNYGKGLEWYAAHFEAGAGKKIIAEKTADYLWANGIGVEGHLPDVHLNIHRALPDAKLIAVLRNPVERAISAVNHIIRSGRVSADESVDELLLGSRHHLVDGHGVIDYGYYHRQLMEFIRLFGGDRLLILIFEEDIKGRPQECLREVCRFLGIDEGFEFSGIEQAVNKGGGSRPGRQVIEKLYRLYEDENEKLYELIGRDIPSWKIENR